MHKRIRHIAIGIVATSLGGALFAFLVWRAGPAIIVEHVQSFGLVAFCGFVALSLANFGLYTLRWKIILQEIEKKNISYTRLFLHRMSGFATGYLTPAAQVAGEPVRVALLATEGISAKAATSSVVIDLAFEIATFVAYVAFGVVLAVVTGVGASTLGWIAYVFLGGLILAVMTFFVSVGKGLGVFQRVLKKSWVQRRKHLGSGIAWLADVEKMMTKFFVGRTRKLVVIVALSCIMTGFRAGEILFIGWGFGQSIHISSAILLSTIPGLVLFAPIPGGLGAFEASTAAMLALLNITTPAVAFTLIIRLRDALFILIGVIHGIQEGAGWMGRRKEKPLVG